ncbi:hypothetical protein L1049_008207 [Liquidambar formosana]|uniref:Protein POLYCHOME n=1 Tax=Liquidambar formosana TaxID=63359 RepID=A0AAP0SAF7_LIQFO
MPESRDRVARPEDVAAMFARRRQLVRSIGVLPDEPGRGANLFGSPFHQGTTGTVAARGPMRMTALRGGGFGRGGFGTPRSGNGRGRNMYGSSTVGRENSPAGTVRRGRGRSTNSVLPSWYPRTPLRDITAVVRAIERRRTRLADVEGQQIESPIPQDQSVLDFSVPNSGAQLEHDISMTSPNPSFVIKPRPPSVGKVPKILLGITNQTAGESEFLTPQKKLLNSIDTVEKVVMEELQKLKRTPTAKKAEREKRVRTLMSMR